MKEPPYRTGLLIRRSIYLPTLPIYSPYTKVSKSSVPRCLLPTYEITGRFPPFPFFLREREKEISRKEKKRKEKRGRLIEKTRYRIVILNNFHDDNNLLGPPLEIEKKFRDYEYVIYFDIDLFFNLVLSFLKFAGFFFFFSLMSSFVIGLWLFQSVPFRYEIITIVSLNQYSYYSSHLSTYLPSSNDLVSRWFSLHGAWDGYIPYSAVSPTNPPLQRWVVIIPWPHEMGPLIKKTS